MTSPSSSDIILITGAAGFIGSNLTDRLLAQGQTVIGLDNFCDFYNPQQKRANIASAMANPRFQLIEIDIRDRHAVLETFAQYHPHAVIHLAAMAGVRPSIENPAYYTSVNLDGTVNLLDAAIAAGSSKFLFASSSSVYGNNPKTPFAEEDNVDHPISPYAATKKAGELLCHSYHHLHHLPISCLRFFTVFGPRQRPDLAITKFMQLIHQEKPIPVFGDGSTSRDYTYIDDILSGILSALHYCSPTGPGNGYRIYNLGGNHPTTLNNLISCIETVVGKKAILNRQPMQPGDVQRTWADLTRSQSELNYQPQTPLLQGLQHQWNWLLSK